jgi:glycolate oxidase
MDIAFDGTSLRLMAGIKRLFDPQGIMNPGKVLP